MDHRRSGDQRVGDVAGFERVVGAAIGEEAAFAACVDERDEPPGRPLGVAGEPRRDANGLEPRRLAWRVGGPDAADEIGPDPERRKPRRLIGRRPAGQKSDRRPPVRSARERPLGADDDVRHDVADDEDAGTGHEIRPGMVAAKRYR